MFVYLVTNKINGKKYVGQTSRELRVRWNRHCLPYSNRDNSYLYNAICKYGRDNFSIEPVVIVGTKWEMDLYERGLIKAWKLRDSRFGYNLTDGGGGMLGFRLSEETKQRMSMHIKSKEHCRRISEAKMGNKSRLGIPHSEESRRRISEAHKGRSLSEEHIAALRVGSHNRYHTKKGIVNPNCKLCQEPDE